MPSAQAQRNGRIVHQSRARLLTKHRSLWLTELIGFTSGIVESQIAGGARIREAVWLPPGLSIGREEDVDVGKPPQHDSMGGRRRWRQE